MNVVTVIKQGIHRAQESPMEFRYPVTRLRARMTQNSLNTRFSEIIIRKKCGTGPG
jgi:hypothetical protein